MPYPDNPHFSLPFRLTPSGGPVVVDQDTDDEIEDCIEVFLSTVIGTRIDEPSYGRPILEFTEGGIDLVHLQNLIEAWEDRAPTVLERVSLENLVDRIRINMRERDV